MQFCHLKCSWYLRIMRLSEHQKETILNIVNTVLGADAVVTLFGSRVDDAAKGGDIDLLVETPRTIPNPADINAQIAAKLWIALHEQKVDILLSAPNLKHYPIHDIAKKNGVRL